ncbi:MAG: flagellar biosynthesis anti-sigma factor FlgM [Candidatus Firestonebacteria bacterium]|nr:flagellar biosynthesis anti-sigma factor FlgM [Candidatus Firestonebacteria bacterium]
MSIDRIQPRNDIDLVWKKENKAIPKKEKSAASPAGSPKKAVNAQTTPGPVKGHAPAEATAAGGKAAAANQGGIWGDISRESLSRLQSISEKVQSVGQQSQLNQQISAVEQEIVVTRQELEKTARAQGNTNLEISGGKPASYWDQLSVSDKARTINRLKDKLEQMELQQSELQGQLSDAINSGSYAVSGEDIVKGMLP